MNHNLSICLPFSRPLLEIYQTKQHQETPALTKGHTPTASFYRIYEYLVRGFVQVYRTEIEHFFNQPEPSWSVSAIPDPKDPDPERYAILALASNRLIERGLARGCPAIITSVEMEELRSRVVVRKEVPVLVRGVPNLERTLVIRIVTADWL